MSESTVLYDSLPQHETEQYHILQKHFPDEAPDYFNKLLEEHNCHRRHLIYDLGLFCDVKEILLMTQNQQALDLLQNKILPKIEQLKILLLS